MKRDLDEIEMELKGAEMHGRCQVPSHIRCAIHPGSEFCGSCGHWQAVEPERAVEVHPAGEVCIREACPYHLRGTCTIYWSAGDCDKRQYLRCSDPSWAQRAGMLERAEVRDWIVVCNGTHELGVAYKDAMPGRDHRQWMTEDEARAKVSEWDGLYKGVSYRAFKWSDGVQG